MKNLLIEFAKSRIESGALGMAGALTAQQASTVLKLLFEDPFFSRVTTRKMAKLTAEGKVLDIASRSLRRVAQGTAPTDDQKQGIDNFNYKLTAEEADLFVDIMYSFIWDNKDNPNLISEIESAFMTKIKAELVDLAFNGQGADYTGDDADFLTLNEGWIKLAEDSDDTNKVSIDPGVDGWVTSLGAVLKAQEKRFVANSALIMSVTDHNNYALEIGKNHDASKYAIPDSKAGGFLTYPVISNMAVPDGKIMFTNPKNLVFGVNTDITKTREANNRLRVVEYTYTMNVDFEIAAKQAVVLATAS